MTTASAQYDATAAAASAKHRVIRGKWRMYLVPMNILLAIGVAGGIGSVLRYVVGQAAQRVFHVTFPIGTLVVNTIGCALVGILARHYLNDETAPLLRAALIVGFCGGFTTFSTFSLETVGLVAAGNWSKAAAYVVASTALCLLGTAAGYQLAMRT